MASRRTRLKGVINLPVRRSAVKEDVPSSNNEPMQAKQPTSSKVTKETDNVSLDDISVERNTCAGRPQNAHSIEESLETEKRVNPKESEIITLDDGDVSSGTKTESLPQPRLKVPLPIRKRLKPSVSLSALSRKPKDTDVENEKASKISGSNICEDTPLSSLEKPTFVNNRISPSSKYLDPNRSQKDQTRSTYETDAGKSPTRSRQEKNKLLPSTAKCVTSSEKVLQKSNYEKPAKKIVDSSSQQSINEEEFEAGNQNNPDSFSRRTSNDLTHSETDEIVENSSQCSNVTSEATALIVKTINATPSITSTVYEDTSEIEDVQPAKVERRPHTHRRPRKSGVGEILSIARRDFYKKFGNNTPDKKKLTMFDLIFYNPTTNPMKHTNKPKLSDQKDTAETVSESVSERIAEESVDDVASVDEQVHSAMPAPQVKVGPDGSLIIDEKSLVIATTGSQQRKDELANSSVVVDYGLGNTTYNSFSKKVKSKEWTKEETLKFYRALQAVGTDFLLMKSIFPNRTRGDLKQKYKKEDRLNRNLVDKILRNPLEFDLTALEQELAQEEKENKRKEEEKHAEKKRIKLKNLKSKGAVVHALLGEFSQPLNTITSSEKKSGKKRISKKRKMVSDGSSTEEEECDIQLDCDFDNEGKPGQNGSTECNESSYLLKSPQPTRYGRVPRVSSLSKEATSTLQQNDIDNNDGEDCEMIMEGNSNVGVDSEREETSVPNSVAQPTFNVSNLSNVEPGSLVILSTPGQKTLQLFMVAPKSQNSALTHIPVAVTPEILASVNSSISLGSPEPSTSTENPVAISNSNNLHTHTNT